MRLAFVLLTLAVAFALPTAATASPETPDRIAELQVVTSTVAPEGNYDPYLGGGGLITKPIEVCCCSTHDYICEAAELGSNCKPGNPQCVCVAFGSCRVP